MYLIQPKRVAKPLLISKNNLDILPEIEELPFDSKGETEGYELYLNTHSLSWITSSDRIYPATPGLWLNNSQDSSTRFSAGSKFQALWTSAELLSTSS